MVFFNFPGPALRGVPLSRKVTGRRGGTEGTQMNLSLENEEGSACILLSCIPYPSGASPSFLPIQALAFQLQQVWVLTAQACPMPSQLARANPAVSRGGNPPMSPWNRTSVSYKGPGQWSSTPSLLWAEKLRIQNF